MITLEEMQETAAALRETTPADTEEMTLICAEIQTARDLQDAIAAELKAHPDIAELQAELERLLAPFKARKAAAQAVVDAATAALVRRIEIDEHEALAAVQARAAVPEPRQLPKGLRATRKTVLTGVDMDVLDDSYTRVVADDEKILRHVEQGHDVPGATIEIKHGAVYTRPKR